MTHLGGRTALPYVAAVDGLRALAVLAVVAYHASLSEMPGGFFGVDVFFVISGYLVTVLFLTRATEHRGVPRPDGLDTAEFWRRRARRLIPAALGAVLVTWAVFAAFGVRDLGDLTAEAFAALIYGGNWFFLFTEHSYFETVSSPSPFLHFWSLAVEAQFYLVWPVLLIGALRFGGRLAAFALAVSLAALSTLVVAALYSPEADPSRAYYGTDARVAGLLLGAALAIVVKPALATRVPRLGVEALGWGGLAALVLLMTQVSEFDAFIYRGGFFLASSATLLVMVAALHGRNTLAWILSRPALRWLGERSYSIYLWHWPVFVLTQPQMSADLHSWSLLAARLGATLILAELSYRLVEHTFRGRSGWRLPEFDLGRGPYLQRPWARPAGVMAVGLVAIVAAGGLPLRIGLADDLAAIQQQITGSATPTQTQTHTQTSPAETPSAEELAASVEDPLPGGSTGAASADASATNPGQTTSGPTATPGETARPPVTSPVVGSAVAPEPTTTTSATPASGTSGTPPAVATATATNDREGGDPPEPSPAGDTQGDGSAVEDPAPSSSTSAASGSSVDGLDGVAAATPSATPDAAPLGASVTVIGDSVALGALPSLQAALPGAVIDAEVGRQFWALPGVIEGLAAQGALGDVVVLSLGANGTFTSDQFQGLMAALGDRTLLMVTVTVPRRWEGEVNHAILTQAEARGFGVVDWHTASVDTGEYFGADGVHLTESGRNAYAALIAQAVQRAIAAGS